jgi:glutathione reductase (NADPH)
MWYTASVAENLRNAHSYGFRVPGLSDAPAEQPIPFDWNTLKHKRDAYIKRLNGIYERNLEKDHVDEYQGRASFTSANELEVRAQDGSTYSLRAKNILIAVGGAPTIPDIEGAEHGISSDGFFELEHQPKRVAVVGAGYISVELAGIFHTLGSETHLLIRHDKVLRTFDNIISDTLTEHMAGTGINIHKETNITKVVKDESSGALTLTLDTGKTLEVDTLLWAIGRHPETKALNLDKAGVKTDDHGFVTVDAYQKTSAANVFAVGDVIGKALLTPVAIAAGRRLSNRLFGGEQFKDDKLDYSNIASVIFSHPTAGSVGLTEAEAKKEHGEDKIKVYQTKFTGMVRRPLHLPSVSGGSRMTDRVRVPHSAVQRDARQPGAQVADGLQARHAPANREGARRPHCRRGLRRDHAVCRRRRQDGCHQEGPRRHGRDPCVPRASV